MKTKIYDIKVISFLKFLFVAILFFQRTYCLANTNNGTAIFIDSRLMVLAHPLFNAYDIKTGRFKGTPSEPFVFDVDSRKLFIDKIKELEDKLLKSPEALKNKLKNVPFKDRISIEREFIKEKKLLETKLDAMKQRVYFSKQVPMSPGMSPYMSIYPQCCDIVETTNEVINELKEKYKTNIVIDIANILPIIKGSNSVPKTNINQNLPQKVYKKATNISTEDIKSWCDKADRYWAEKLGLDADIIPFGAKDVRLEAIKLMEEKGKTYKLWDWNKENNDYKMSSFNNGEKEE